MANTVQRAFDVLLKRQQLTDKQREAARVRTEALSRFLLATFTMAEKPFTFGSSSRGTICAGQRDIDVLAPFATGAYWERRYVKGSRAFLYWARDALDEHYGQTQVSSRQLAIRIDFRTIAVEVVPSFPKMGGGYWMPNGSGDWQSTNPSFFAQILEKQDMEQNERLKPLIRLLKAWNIANDSLLSSFHLEVMVTRMLRGKKIPEWSTAVASTLRALVRWVDIPISDPGHGTVLLYRYRRLDRYLKSETRKDVKGLLRAAAEQAEQAEAHRSARDVEQAFALWNRVYRGTFPAYN